MHTPTWLLCCERMIALSDQVEDARKRHDLDEVRSLRAQSDALRMAIESQDYEMITDGGI